MIPRTIYVGHSMMFQVLDRELAATTTSNYPYASITITNPDMDFVTLASSPNQKGALRLRFEDFPIADPDFAYFTERQAEQILDFYEAYKRHVKVFIINCEKGINRSAAVAAALSRIANGEDAWFFERFRPNPLVYDTLLAVYQERLRQ